MTVTTTGNRAEFAGNGVTTAFSYPNKFLLNADLTVLLVDDEGVETLQVLDSDYTLTGVGAANGGTVTMAVAPPTGSNLVVYGNPTFNQPYDIGENEIIPAETTETAWDRVVLFCQSLKNALSRTIRLADGETTVFDPKLPPLVPNTLIGINEDGDGLALTDATTFKGETGDTGPEGPQGDPGDAATIAVGTVTTVDPGDPATVTNSGTASEAVFDFEIPKGEPGESTSLITVSDQLPDDGVGANGDVWIFLDDGNPDNGNFYQKTGGTYALQGNIIGPAGGVNSFNSRTGAVTPAASDYDADQVDFTPAGSLAATDVQAALEELDGDVGTVQSNLDDHEAETTAAHAASAIAFTPGSGITATDVQAAIEEAATMGGGGGGGSLHWSEIGLVPLPGVEHGLEHYAYPAAGLQVLTTVYTVPSNYVAGTQLKMKVKAYGDSGTGTRKLETVATLLRTGTDAASSTTNQHTSTNTALANPGAGVVFESEMDITDADGEMNSVAVSPGDTIPILLGRGTDTATDDIKVWVFTAEVFSA